MHLLSGHPEQKRALAPRALAAVEPQTHRSAVVPEEAPPEM